MTQAPGAAPLLVANRRCDPTSRYGSMAARVHDEAAFADVKAEIPCWPGYAPTPLLDRPGLAARLGLGRVWCKHEGHRFGIGSFKALGPPYAMLQILRNVAARRLGRSVTLAEVRRGDHAALLSDVVFVAASSGNHGRAMAWAARRYGCRAVVYMSEGVSAGRAAAIAGLGAEVRRAPGNFDAVVRRAEQDSGLPGHVVLSDTVYPDHPDVARHTLQGYSLCADEILDQLADRGEAPPTHFLVAAGNGTLAGGCTARLWQRMGAARPRVVVVEPLTAASVCASLARGSLATVEGSLATVMDGLSVGYVGPVPWQVLSEGAFAGLAISDSAAVAALRQLAAGADGDPPLAVGETGIATVAALQAAAADPAIRGGLGLGPDSRVVAILCEGPTDPAVFRELTGIDPASLDDAA